MHTIHSLTRELLTMSNKATPVGENAKVLAVQKKVEDAAYIARHNIDVLIARQEDLERVNQQALELENRSEQFKDLSQQVRKKFWWQDCRSKGCIVLIALVVLAIIVIAITIAVS